MRVCLYEHDSETNELNSGLKETVKAISGSMLLSQNNVIEEIIFRKLRQVCFPLLVSGSNMAAVKSVQEIKQTVKPYS